MGIRYGNREEGETRGAEKEEQEDEKKEKRNETTGLPGRYFYITASQAHSEPRA